MRRAWQAICTLSYGARDDSFAMAHQLDAELVELPCGTVERSDKPIDAITSKAPQRRSVLKQLRQRGNVDES